MSRRVNVNREYYIVKRCELAAKFRELQAWRSPTTGRRFSLISFYYPRERGPALRKPLLVKTLKDDEVLIIGQS